ncbi:MAG: hypothetical protein DHS20C06_01800 [Hyphobacterium sp.]|nr:MAG: hypothetical protein DHS20C06_01800 [Hyphobacterium sp.]
MCSIGKSADQFPKRRSNFYANDVGAWNHDILDLHLVEEFDVGGKTVVIILCGRPLARLPK